MKEYCEGRIRAPSPHRAAFFNSYIAASIRKRLMVTQLLFAAEQGKKVNLIFINGCESGPFTSDVDSKSCCAIEFSTRYRSVSFFFFFCFLFVIFFYSILVEKQMSKMDARLQ